MKSPVFSIRTGSFGMYPHMSPISTAPRWRLTSLAALRQLAPAVLPAVADNVRIGPCVANAGKFVCIGLNYADHAEESGMPIPDEPVIFMKATSAICGPE